MKEEATQTKEITQAATECRAAWAPCNIAWEGMHAWNVHHDEPLELLTCSPEERISCILEEKPENERITRLNNFRPVLSQLPIAVTQAWQAYIKAERAYEEAQRAYATSPDGAAAHLADAPHHTWNGVSIFVGP